MRMERDKGKVVCGRWYERLGQYPRLIAIGGIGVLLMLIGPMLEGDADRQEPDAIATQPVAVMPAEVWENKLTQILSEIDGAGKVEVAVRMGAEEVVYEKNGTTETRSADDGKNKTTDEKVTQELAMRRENGVESPIVRRTITPAIVGVVVVADGGADSMVRLNIRKAVCAATGVAAHRISVLSRRR